VKAHHLSTHADQRELPGWLAHPERPARRVWLAHGEEENAAAFAQVIRNNAAPGAVRLRRGPGGKSFRPLLRTCCGA